MNVDTLGGYMASSGLSPRTSIQRAPIEREQSTDAFAGIDSGQAAANAADTIVSEVASVRKTDATENMMYREPLEEAAKSKTVEQSYEEF